MLHVFHTSCLRAFSYFRKKLHSRCLITPGFIFALMKAWECLVMSEIFILHAVEKWHTKNHFFLANVYLVNSFILTWSLWSYYIRYGVLHLIRCKHCKICLSFATRLAVVLAKKLATSILATTVSFKIKLLQKFAQYFENKTFI